MPKPAPAEDSIGKKDIGRDLNDRINAIEKDMLELQALESETYGTWKPEDKAKRMADLKAEKQWLIGKKQELGFPVYTPPQPTRTPTPAPSPAPTPAPTRSPELQRIIQQKLQQGESPEIIERAIQIMQGQ